MEFIKVGKNYMIKNSNGRIVSEKEKLELENKELVIEDIKSNKCQGKTTQRISKNKKKIAELKKDNVKINIDVQPLDSKKIVKYIKEETALNKEVQDEIIEETDTAI
jgi:hydroxypyruvate isomerase